MVLPRRVQVTNLALREGDTYLLGGRVGHLPGLGEGRRRRLQYPNVTRGGDVKGGSDC